jgi:hypothetical protein
MWFGKGGVLVEDSPFHHAPKLICPSGRRLSTYLKGGTNLTAASTQDAAAVLAAYSILVNTDTASPSLVKALPNL